MTKDRNNFFQHHPDPMWIHDPVTLRFLDVNNAAIAKYGNGRDAFLVMTLTDIGLGEDESGPRMRDQTITDGAGKAGIWQHRLGSGAVIDVDITTRAIDHQGRAAVDGYWYLEAVHDLWHV